MPEVGGRAWNFGGGGEEPIAEGAGGVEGPDAAALR